MSRKADVHSHLQKVKSEELPTRSGRPGVMPFGGILFLIFYSYYSHLKCITVFRPSPEGWDLEFLHYVGSS
jgi:hypothetical protein